MLDPQLLRTDPEAVSAKLSERGYDLDAAQWRDLDARRKELQIKTQELQNQKNLSAKSIGQAKQRGEDIQPLLDQVKHLGEELSRAEDEFAQLRERQQSWLMEMPNLQLDGVPAGKDENDNVEVRKWGEPGTFDFEPRDHIDIGEALGMLDFDMASRISGARFAVMRGQLAHVLR